MTTLTRRDSRGSLDILDWLEGPWTILRPVAGHPVRMEDYVLDGSYVVRAQLAGIDPEKDLEVTVSKGILTIKAERRDKNHGKHHSEFHYGTFARTLTLPAGASEEHIEALYDSGVLEITVALADKSAEQVSRTIPVRLIQHIKAT
jgi:HSP20 family protein